MVYKQDTRALVVEDMTGLVRSAEHALYAAKDAREAKSFLPELWREVSSRIPTIPVWGFVVGGVGLLVLVVAWNTIGKGEGSHAGREQPRRAYRRELARQMAREDAKKIEAGEKKRRKWMQW